MIALSDCKPGYLYRISSRNLRMGVFRPNESFVGIRHKFDNYYLDAEWHAENQRGTATPLEEICECPLSDLREFGDLICEICGKPAMSVRNETTGYYDSFHSEDHSPTCKPFSTVLLSNKELFDWLEEQGAKIGA